MSGHGILFERADAMNYDRQDKADKKTPKQKMKVMGDRWRQIMVSGVNVLDRSKDSYQDLYLSSIIFTLIKNDIFRS